MWICVAPVFLVCSIWRIMMYTNAQRGTTTSTWHHQHIKYVIICRWIPVYTDPSKKLGVMSIGFLLQNRDDAVIWRGPKKNGRLLLIINFTSF